MSLRFRYTIYLPHRFFSDNVFKHLLCYFRVILDLKSCKIDFPILHTFVSLLLESKLVWYLTTKEQIYMFILLDQPPGENF